ncbi:MAG: hypothetical protein HY589_05800 [Candidatus Omnitrophica bacterium]|nr:hypothetical protein [Candidatus Omnitrophota bacterium]
MKKIFFLIVGFIGWILSPLTWWNDSFVNLPLAYLLGSALSKISRRGFLTAFLVSYWLTNVLGILLMFAGAYGMSAKGLLKDRLRAILITILVYSVISAILVSLNIIRPF